MMKGKMHLQCLCGKISKASSNGKKYTPKPTSKLMKIQALRILPFKIKKIILSYSIRGNNVPKTGIEWILFVHTL